MKCVANVNGASKIDIIGINITSITTEVLIAELNKRIDERIRTRICVTPVNCLTAAHKLSKLKQLYNSADFVLCDGVPVLWASRFLGTPIQQRITGLDLLPTYIEECVRKRHSMYFLGAKDGVGEKLVSSTLNKYPNAKIVGYYSPPFAEKFSDDENQKIIGLINKAKPDVLWVSFTAPKQDFWIYENLNKIDTIIAIGVGGAFEVTAGLISRAPLFFQKNGLEWLYRFLKEPKRLFKRYFIEAPVFIPMVIKQRFRKDKYV